MRPVSPQHAPPSRRGAAKREATPPEPAHKAVCAEELNDFLIKSLRAVARVKKTLTPESITAATRQELEDIKRRIAAVLTIQEDDSHMHGGEELHGVQDTLVTALSEYKKTCQARKNVLAAVEHGLGKLGAELSKEEDMPDEETLGKSTAWQDVVGDLRHNHDQLRSLHEQELLMLQKHIQSMAEPLAAATKLISESNALKEASERAQHRAAADQQALSDELVRLETATLQAFNEQQALDAAQNAKRKMQFAAEKELREEVARHRSRLAALEADVAHGGEKHQAAIDELEAQLKQKSERIDQLTAELSSVQHHVQELDALRNEKGQGDEMRANISQLEAELAQARSAAVRMQNVYEQQLERCVGGQWHQRRGMHARNSGEGRWRGVG